MEKEIIAKWKIKEPEAARILKLLPELAEKTKKEKGNLFYTIYQSEADSGELIFHERYAGDDAVETHKKSDHYQNIVLKEIIPHLEVREVTAVKKLL